MPSDQASLQERRAVAYYERALEFLNAYFELSLAHSYQKLVDKDLQLASAKLTLVGHALELTLRGWLATREQSETSDASGVGPADAMDRNDARADEHDLVALTRAVVAHYPALWAYLDNGTIARLNASYLAASGLDGALPDDRATMAALMPLDAFANVVGKLRHDLGAILGLADAAPFSASDAPRQRRRRPR